MTRRIYLAGPEVFLPDPAEAAARMKAICTELGLEGLFPQDAQLSPMIGEPPARFAARIRAANIALIQAADGVIANVGPFRGPSADDGTAFEIGYAVALARPVFCWSGESGTLLDRSRRRLDLSWDGAAWRDPEGLEVEEFGLPVNLMLVDPARPVVYESFAAAARACAAHFSAGGA